MHHRSRPLPILLAIFLPSLIVATLGQAQTPVAYLDGSSLVLPSVNIGSNCPLYMTIANCSQSGTFYTLTFTIDTASGSEEIVLKEIVELEDFDPKSSAVHPLGNYTSAVYDEQLELLRVPFLQIGDDTFWVNFKLLDGIPLRLAIADFAKFEKSIPPPLDDPITWDNVVSRQSELSKIFYEDFHATIARNREAGGYKVPYRIFRGPNSNPANYTDIEVWLDDLFAFYANAGHRSDEQLFLIHGLEDVEWAKETVASPEVDFASYIPIIEIANPESGGGATFQNMAVTPPGVAIGFWSLTNSFIDNSDGRTQEVAEMATVGHEYGHQVHQTQFWWRNNQSNLHEGGNPDACWLVEGVASMSELALSLKTYSDFKANNLQRRNSAFFENSPLARDRDVTAEEVEDYLNRSSIFQSECNRADDYRLAYSLGYFAAEALAAIKGAEAPMQLFAMFATGSSWERAFLEIFDIEWSDAVPILGKVIEVTYAE
jgi:hypothetical protein